MARSSNQKKKLSLLRSILLERTGPEHPISMKEIISALDAYGVSAERKSIYNDLETLRELGLDIQTVKGRYSGYYVGMREFELPELKLLVDAVRASKFITEKKSAVLIKKLASLANEHDRKSLNRAVFVSNRTKSDNEDIYKAIDVIHDAIEADKCISFSYFSWTPDKKKELRNDGKRYDVSPWSLVWDDSNYYLVGFDNEKKEIRHYRVDKMLKIVLAEKERSGEEEFKKFDIASYSGSVFGMFGGAPERVTLSCANRLANVMLDKFGSDITILNDGDGDRFRIHVNVVPSPVFLGWIMGFGSDVEIISPDSVSQKLKNLHKLAK